MAIYATSYVVRGNSGFPLDMLRYDSSYPVTEGDSLLVKKSLLGERDGDAPVVYSVVVRHIGTDKAWRPTFERWQSFGWTVAETATHKRNT